MDLVVADKCLPPKCNVEKYLDDNPRSSNTLVLSLHDIPNGIMTHTDENDPFSYDPLPDLYGQQMTASTSSEHPMAPRSLWKLVCRGNLTNTINCFHLSKM